jgi:hypothetical protein
MRLRHRVSLIGTCAYGCVAVQPGLRSWCLMEWLRSLWIWIRENPWVAIGGAILLFGAIGGGVKWLYEIARVRPGAKQSKRDE